MFKQKLSFRTQMALVKLISDIKEAVALQDEGVSKWTGEFVLSYDDGRRYPRLIIFMDHSVQGVGFGQWWTDDPDQGLTADEDLLVLMRG